MHAHMQSMPRSVLPASTYSRVVLQKASRYKLLLQKRPPSLKAVLFSSISAVKLFWRVLLRFVSFFW